MQPGATWCNLVHIHMFLVGVAMCEWFHTDITLESLKIHTFFHNHYINMIYFQCETLDVVSRTIILCLLLIADPQMNNLSSECTFKLVWFQLVKISLCTDYMETWPVLMWHSRVCSYLRIFLQRLHWYGCQAAFKRILLTCCFKACWEIVNFKQKSQTYLENLFVHWLHGDMTSFNVAL